MTPDQQFWWNWTVGVAGVAANLLVVLVALFGERFWSWEFPPTLKIKLLERFGEKTVAVGQQNGVTIRNDVRFFHLQVWNERRKWSPAHGVQVFLTSIEEVGPNGKYQVTWVGNVPMRWRDQEVVPVTATLGAPKDADILMVGKQDLVLSLMPLIAPNNLPVHRQGKCRCRSTASSTFKRGGFAGFPCRGIVGRGLGRRRYGNGSHLHAEEQSAP